ncbi:MAG TPA: hypothetical protein VNM47_09045 [Terriglobia bacterium]|nr:hypothetical protein [Terriglobia bacterium]
MKNLGAIRPVWTQSLGVVARSPIYVLTLAAVAGLWGLGAYEWLWLPESSVWVLTLTVVWFLALVWIALAVLAGSAANASSVASVRDRQFRLRKILNFEKRRLGRTFLVVLAGTLLYLVLGAVFGWLDAHALNVGSFLTFQLQNPVSSVIIASILWFVEAIIWIIYAGFVITWLLEYSSPPQAMVPRNARQTLAQSVSLSVFLTSLLSLFVFGGLVWGLATSRPVFKPGAWDYAQFLARNGIALLLVTIGWLFWVLALARLATPAVTAPTGSPPVA